MDETENAIKKKGMWVLHEGECERNPHSYPSICHRGDCPFEFPCADCGKSCCGLVMNDIDEESLCPDCFEEAEIIKYSEEKRKSGD